VSLTHAVAVYAVVLYLKLRYDARSFATSFAYYVQATTGPEHLVAGRAKLAELKALERSITAFVLQNRPSKGHLFTAILGGYRMGVVSDLPPLSDR
jgi:hypothetical protein